jgi:hypothetical protein
LFTLNNLGALAAISFAFLLLYRYRSQPHIRRLPVQAFLGTGIVFAATYLAVLGVAPIAVFLTPIAWTGYILWIDGAVFSLRGESLLRTYPAEFATLALCSIPLWLIFEAYNLRLDNWIYLGLPQHPILRYSGYAWAFATIWPGIFETAMFLRALGWHTAERHDQNHYAPPANATSSAEKSAVRTSVKVGALLLTIPLIVPAAVGAYLFGAVWLGFIFLLDPLNYRAGRPSLWGDLRSGDSSRLKALLWTGVLCGVYWEFWNHIAIGRWFYTVPIMQDWKVFAMPLPGYLGFPAFAVECFVMFAFIGPQLTRLKQLLGGQPREWKVFDL